MVTKQEMKKNWDKLAKLAEQHREASDLFNKVAEEYYGVKWDWLASIADNDSIIDTIDYGTDSLTFKEFEVLVRFAMVEQEAGE